VFIDSQKVDWTLVFLSTASPLPLAAAQRYVAVKLA
jgi:hypothetical protein